MKQFIIIIFLVHNISYSQSQIDLKFYNACLDSIVTLDHVIQPFDFSNTEDFNFRNDSIINIKPGKYIVNVIIEDNDPFYKTFEFTKVINNNMVYNDTIELPKVIKKYTNTSQYAHIYHGYLICDKICDGYVIDYYKNGIIRLEGNFENGMPKNEIRKYDTKGQLVEIEIYDNYGFIKETKYPD